MSKSQREDFEELMCRALPHTHRNDGRFDLDERGDYRLIGVWTAFQCYKQMLSEQSFEFCGVWQFFWNGNWHVGMNHNDHRENTEAAGYPTRDLYYKKELPDNE